MGQRLVDLRVERVALLSVGHQAEAAERRLQRVGDRLDTTGQLPVLPGLVDGVKHGQQAGQRGGHRLLAHRGPVPVDALAVVGVLGLQPLHVRGPLRELRLDVDGLLAVLHCLRCNHLWCLFGGLPRLILTVCFGTVCFGTVCFGLVLSGLRGGGRPAGTCGAGRLGCRVLPPNLAGYRVDAPVVMDDRTGARLLGCWHQAAPPSRVSSSTISASTTSSSAGVLLLPSAEPACEFACWAW